MSLQRRRYVMLVLWLIVLTMVPACSSGNINSGMDEQVSTRSSVPAEGPVEAKVSLPEPVEPSERRLPEPTAVEPPPNPLSPTVEPPEMRLPEQPTAVEPPNPISSTIDPLPTLTDVYFDFDQYAIRSDAQSTLKATASILKAQSNPTIVVEGHCDERGTNAYNMVLGERRAQAVQRQLQTLGVSMSQLQIASYGKEHPVCTEHSETCRQLNRRVHFSWP